MNKNNNNARVFINQGNIKGKILHRARKKKDIIFGAQSIKKQIGLLARPTSDFDIFTGKSKSSAKEVEKQLDKLTRGDNFFVKKGKNPETWKVKWRGKDLMPRTEDDKTIVDYTTAPKPLPKFRIINDIRYRKLSEELKAKQRIVKNPLFKFRREKDLEDIRRIRLAGKNIRKA